MYLLFDSQKVQTSDLATNDVVLEGRAKGGLYELLRMNHRGASLSYENLSHFLWHCQLSHLNSAYYENLYFSIRV